MQKVMNIGTRKRLYFLSMINCSLRDTEIYDIVFKVNRRFTKDVTHITEISTIVMKLLTLIAGVLF